MPTTITTSTSSTATAHSNQRKIDRCQNGVLWAGHTDGGSGNHALKLSYSTDDGATWTAAADVPNASGDTSTPNFTRNAAFFIDVDDYCHVVAKEQKDGYLFYRRGTPNAGRTAWTWSSAVSLTGASDQWSTPDIIAHPEGTGWAVHVIASYLSGSKGYVDTLTFFVSSGGTISYVGTDDRLESGVSSSLSGEMVWTGNAGGFPSIDFHHTGDGKTVAGGTPHLYATWSGGPSSSTKPGIHFKKATYSGGTWTWGTDRTIDSARSHIGGFRWLNCLYDGTRVIIGGLLYDGADSDLVLYERDAADTTTTTRVLTDNTTTADHVGFGTLTYDGDGNVYIFGRNAGEGAGLKDLAWRKWTRATTTLGSATVIDANTEDPYVSAKRGYSNGRIEFVYTDGTASPYTVTYDSTSLNVAPNAPTSLSPNGATLDKDATQRFTWTFSDPDAGDAQSAYDLRYRVQGTSTWTTVSGGNTQYHDFPAGTFTAGDWEWQARTTDNSGAVGPYSSSSTFTAASSPAAPSITDPINNGTIATETHTVRWTAASQDAYEVRRVADAAGSPDTSTVYSTSGTVVSTGKSRSLTFDVNGRTEHVQVRVRKDALWSSWASVKVAVSYTVPATPTLTATADSPVAGAVRVQPSHPAPTGDEPTVTSVDLWRRETSDASTEVRLVVGAPASAPIDVYTSRSGVSYEFRLRAYGDNGTTSWSAWTG